MSKFVKGDPRINRKGRPKSFNALRELAQQIAHETAKSDGKDVILGGYKDSNGAIVGGHKVTVSARRYSGNGR